MTRLRLATTIDVSALGAPAAAQRARAYEQIGVDLIAMSEAYGLDAVSGLGFLAGQTERVLLMAQILPLYSRTPALTAMTAAGLDAVSQGRFVLGIGASGPQVVEGWHGVAYDAPLARTRELVDICRRVWARERLVHSGRAYQVPLPAGSGTGLGKPLKLAARPVRGRIPIFVAALGPANVELVATVADGWVPYLYIPELADRVWGEPLARGLADRPEELPPLEIVAGGEMAIGADVTHLRARARDRVALYVGGMGGVGRNFYARVMEKYGWADEAARVQELYLSGAKAEAAAAVPSDFLERVTMIGDEDYVRRRLHAFIERGVTILQVDPVGPDPVADLARLRALIDEMT